MWSAHIKKHIESQGKHKLVARSIQRYSIRRSRVSSAIGSASQEQPTEQAIANITKFDRHMGLLAENNNNSYMFTTNNLKGLTLQEHPEEDKSESKSGLSSSQPEIQVSVRDYQQLSNTVLPFKKSMSLEDVTMPSEDKFAASTSLESREPCRNSKVTFSFAATGGDAKSVDTKSTTQSGNGSDNSSPSNAPKEQPPTFIKEVEPIMTTPTTHVSRIWDKIDDILQSTWEPESSHADESERGLDRR